MRHQVLHFPALQIADVEPEPGQRHVEVTVHFLQILLVLVRRPGRPCPVPRPGQAADQAACFIPGCQGHHDLPLSRSASVDLVDVSHRQGRIELPEHRLSDAFVFRTGDVEDAVFQRRDGDFVLAGDVEGIKPLHLLVQSVMI